MTIILHSHVSCRLIIIKDIRKIICIHLMFNAVKLMNPTIKVDKESVSFQASLEHLQWSSFSITVQLSNRNVQQSRTVGTSQRCTRYSMNLHQINKFTKASTHFNIYFTSQNIYINI